jgi:selT/selW/selH-like putative selenoprotein
VNGNQNAPRSGAFEITINDKLVYSKFETDTFPNEQEIEKILNG